MDFLFAFVNIFCPFLACFSDFILDSHGGKYVLFTTQGKPGLFVLLQYGSKFQVRSGKDVW